MNPGERIDAILEIVRVLEGEDWATVNLYLESFDVPTDNWWHGDNRSYLIAMLKLGAEQSLSNLYQFVTNNQDGSEGPNIFGQEFLLFVSHLAPQKFFAAEISGALSRYGIRTFVAHDEINPGTEWIQEIQSALSSCNALLALHHPGFAESDWTAQEVGWVLGRGLPIVSVRLGEDPRGFISPIQAIAGSPDKEASRLVEEVVAVLMNESRTRASLVNAVVRKISKSTSWDQTNQLFRFLDRNGIVLTFDHVQQLIETEQVNVDLAKAFEWRNRRGKLAETYGITLPDVPF